MIVSTIPFIIVATSSFATANACSIGSCPAMSTNLLLSRTIQVSATSLNSCKPNSALSILAFSASNGIVTTAITTAPASFANCEITGIEPVPEPPPIPARTKTISEPETAFFKSLIASFAASLPLAG